MWRSGFLLLALFGAVLVVEHRAAARRELPFAWGIAAALALGVTLSVGSVQGVAQAWRQRGGASPGAPSTWRDGEVVQIEGLLRRQHASDPPRSAPFSGRPAAYLAYGAWSPRTPGDVSLASRAHWRGRVADALLLETASDRVPLVGMPPVRLWPEDQMHGDRWYAAAARHLLATTWRAGSLHDAGDEAGVLLEALAGDAVDTSGRIDHHVMSAEAAEALGLRSPRFPEHQALERRLAERPWTFTERVVPPDARVTVIGTWRMNPPRLDVGLSPRTPQHEVRLGAAAPLARAAWRTTLLFALSLMVLTVAGHVLVLRVAVRVSPSPPPSSTMAPSSQPR